MTNVLIIGGGLTGLATALFLARRGHTATILERDADEPPVDPLDAFDGWRRSGVAQRRQSHNFLARASKVLSAEAPDVVDALIAGGADCRAASIAGTELEDGLIVLSARRLMFEAIFRGVVVEEPNVELRAGVQVEALLAESSDSGAPHITGVRTVDGEELRCDFVVDASGRHSQSPKWLAEVGAREVPERLQQCGFFYLTRWYRLNEGQELPEFTPPVIANLDYAMAMAFAADNGFFSFTTVMSVNDPLRLAIRDGAVFDRFIADIPLLAPWIERGEPVSEAEPLTRIDNRYRKLVDDQGPLVTGMALVGDAAVHTNPTMARGVSLAFVHAQHLAETVADAATDPLAYAAQFAAWTSANMGVWYNSQVANDVVMLERLEAALEGKPTPQPTHDAARFTRALFDLAETESTVGLALARVGNLLITPVELVQDAEVVGKVMSYLETDPNLLAVRSDGPSRQEFEALLS